MKKIFLLFVYFSSISTYSQVNYTSSSSSTLFKIINNKQIAFTTIYTNNNGVESKKCIIDNSIEVDCILVSDCFNKNDCQEIEKILKTKKKEDKKEDKKELKKNKNDVFIKVYVNKSEVFIGEQLSVISKIYTKHGVVLEDIEKIPTINYNGFWVNERIVNINDIKQENSNGIHYNVRTFRHSVLTPQKSGTLNIPSLTIEALITRRGKLIGYNFFGRVYERKEQLKTLTSPTKKIKVKKLPKSETEHFYGTVSEEFEMFENIDKTNLKTGEAISFKLTFRGKGNINMLQPFEIQFPNSFIVFDEPIIIDGTYTGNRNTSGEKTFEYILIPKDSGEFKIPEIRFNYFNPKTKEYKEMTTKEYLISVKKGKQYMTNDSTQSALQNLSLLKNSGFSSIKKRQFISKWYSFFYWIILTIIILSYLVHFIISKRNINPSEVKRRKSTKIAIKRLKNARFCIKTGNFDQFFEEIEKSIWGYFADKFEVNASKLSKETIDFYFDKRNINIKTKNNFISLLNICEFARYSPSKDRGQKMERTLENAKEIIIEVESDLKKK